jgi:hypothetical protein
MPRLQKISALTVFALFFLSDAVLAEDNDLKGRIESLERQVSELNERLKEKESVSEAISRFKISGEYRNRAQIQVNTINNYTNAGGETLHAYEHGRTITHDYGWWDHRLQLNTETTFYSTHKLIVDLEIEDAVWGNQAPLFEGQNSGDVTKFDETEIEIKQLYMDIGLYPFSLRGRIGRQEMLLGSGLLFGNRHDGFRFYYPGDVYEIGIMHTRQWEGENAEMTSSLNDDEDTYIIYAKREGETDAEIFGLLKRMHVSKETGDLFDFSPLYLLPGFTQADYTSQEHYMAGAGLALKRDFGNWTARFEGDYVWGTVYSSNPAKDDIEIGGFALFGKVDYRQSETSRIAFSAGYGTGDDPDTTDYEGFFAPDNNFGIEEGYTERYLRRYTMVYEDLAPGAGIPGMLNVKPGPHPIGTNEGFYSFGTGGLENTTFAMLSWDYTGLPRHRFYFGGAYIRASEPNPDTDSSEIGFELDGLVEYYFTPDVNFSLHGGHLFMTGEYFGRSAGDAANLVGEFRLRF